MTDFSPDSPTGLPAESQPAVLASEPGAPQTPEVEPLETPPPLRASGWSTSTPPDTYLAPADFGWAPADFGWAPRGTTGNDPDPENVSGPPWPRLVASDADYRPPRLLRWPIVVGVAFAVFLILDTATAATTSHTPASSAASLGAKVVAAPPGFMLTRASGARNGPMDPSAFNSWINIPGAAAELHYVTGYQVLYDSIPPPDIIWIALFRFTTPADASNFTAGFTRTGYTQQNDAAIPGALRYDPGRADNTHGYVHEIIAARRDTVMIVDYSSSSAQHPALLDTLARQQYARL